MVRFGQPRGLSPGKPPGTLQKVFRRFVSLALVGPFRIVIPYDGDAPTFCLSRTMDSSLCLPGLLLLCLCAAFLRRDGLLKPLSQFRNRQQEPRSQANDRQHHRASAVSLLSPGNLTNSRGPEPHEVNHPNPIANTIPAHNSVMKSVRLRCVSAPARSMVRTTQRHASVAARIISSHSRMLAQ